MTDLNNFCIKYGYPTFEEYYLKYMVTFLNL